MSAVPRLHLVTDARVLAAPAFLTHAEEVSKGPDIAIHCRHAQTGRAMLETALALRETTRSSGSALIVNDRADVAVLAEADGVHLPNDGLSVTAARSLVGPTRLVGQSVPDAVRGVDAGADYVMLGPIWSTPSHPGRPPLGLDAIRSTRGIVVIAVGGITPDRVAPCLDAGAHGVAVVSAVWDSPGPGRVVEQILLSFGS